MPDPQSEGVTLPTLVMTGGPLDGTTYPLAMTSKDVVLGSSMDADVQIMLGNVEPYHARLTFSPSGLTIGDAGSATGTFVNGEKVEGSLALQEGDRICLGPPGAKGSAKLVVRIPSGGVASAAPATGSSEGASPFIEAEAAPLIIDDGQQPLALELDAPPPAAEPVAPLVPPPAEGAAATGEEILAAEEVLVDDATAGPPLLATEAPPEDASGALFDKPLPPAAPPPPPPPPTEAPPPLTAPPPPEADEQTEPPSLSLEPEEEPAPAAAPELAPAAPAAPAEPAPRPAPARARPRGRGRRGSRRSRRPSIPFVPVVGALAAIGLLGAASWWFFLRGATSPELTAVKPATVESGQAVTLTGKSFASDPGGNTVLFGAQPAAVTVATESQLVVVVPDGFGDAPSVAVVVTTAGGSSKPVSVGLLRKPRVTALEPDVALAGESVLIRGERLSGPVTVTIGNVTAEVTEATEETVRVVVPELSLPEGQKTAVVVKAGNTAAAPAELIIGRLPLVLEISPSSGGMGERVVVKGRGFDPIPSGNAVTFGGTPALVLASAPTEITVVAPATPSGAAPDVPVVVTVGGQGSTGHAGFTVTRITTSRFLPHFFPAPVPEYPDEPLVFVSTQLAPVLLLGGPGESTSTGVRAAEAATALNDIVTAATSREVAIEARDDPPSVGLVGQAGPLLVATPADAAAYAKPWGTNARSGPRLSPRALARHWAAILQDYVDLFLYRHRPLKVLALSNRGQVFKEIYGEAARRAPGGTGVGTSIVYPASERVATGLRAAALIPSGGNPRREVEVEGRWSGMLEDPETGAYRFEARFRRDGAGLAGSLTAWRGEIEARSPLRNIRYRGGTLHFTSDLRGTALEFEGELDRSQISGTARRQGKSPATFSMRYVE